jgi:His-Xaa-Ser system protein HxsD
MEPVFNTGSCTCSIDTKVYALEAVTKAAYLFLDRAYVYLYHDEQGRLVVRFKPKPECLGILSDIVNEFLNELLNQNVRLQVARETANLRELIMARALYSTVLETLPPDELVPGLDDSGRADPLAIGRDWFAQTEEAGSDP